MTIMCGDRYADSIGALWEVVDILDDGRVKLWNRSYNAFRTVPIDELKSMKRA